MYYDRSITQFDGTQVERVEDYAYQLGIKGRTANEISAAEHLKVLACCTQFVDSAVSKTCNVGDDVTFEEFKNLYYDAWKLVCKGITTFRAAGKRYGVLNKADEDKAEACFIDPDTEYVVVNKLHYGGFYNVSNNSEELLIELDDLFPTQVQN